MALTDLFSGASAAARTHRRPLSLRTALDVWRSRRALMRLDATRLNDIGISAQKAAAEAAKPVWDVPANWRE